MALQGVGAPIRVTHMVFERAGPRREIVDAGRRAGHSVLGDSVDCRSFY